MKGIGEWWGVGMDATIVGKQPIYYHNLKRASKWVMMEWDKNDEVAPLGWVNVTQKSASQHIQMNCPASTKLQITKCSGVSSCLKILNTTMSNPPMSMF